MARRNVTIVASDGRKEGISWYEGATEQAVMKCARLALGLPPNGSAHLVWKSGDIVDFGKPVTDGVTLYLDTTLSPHENYWSSGNRRPFTGGAGSSRRSQKWIGPNRGKRRLDAPVDERTGPSVARLDEATSLPNEMRERPTGAKAFIRRWLSARGAESDAEKNSDDEKRPLLMTRKSSSSSSFSPEKQKQQQRQQQQQQRRCKTAYSALFACGWRRSSDRLLAKGTDGSERVDPEQQRRSILKLKRILAHLANERTLLAWVRVMGKMFTAGTLSMSLASSTGGGAYSVCFLILGTTYLALCPYVVYIGANRYYQVADVMSGSVHETYSFFAGGHLRGMNALMSLLAVLTVGVMVTQLLTVTLGLL